MFCARFFLSLYRSQPKWCHFSFYTFLNRGEIKISPPVHKGYFEKKRYDLSVLYRWKNIRKCLLSTHSFWRRSQSVTQSLHGFLHVSIRKTNSLQISDTLFETWLSNLINNEAVDLNHDMLIWTRPEYGRINSLQEHKLRDFALICTV